MKAMEKRQQIDAVYIDFTKAFDRVPHSLSVKKLDKMGLPSWLTRWILSYLTERSAHVRIAGISSDSFEITSGVPEGSHLGPLLFVLFVNDLCLDDLKLFRVVSSLTDCCAVQADIDALVRWCMLNGMEVNVQKCCVITFSRKRNVIDFGYRMSATNITRVNTVKDLGVLLDSKLNFAQHIAATTAKAYAVLGFIKRNTQEFEDVYCLKSLYCSLVRSILEYGVLVWAPYHTTQSNRIERIQRNFIRYALRRLPWTDPVRLPPYEHRCALVHLETLACRRVLLQRLFVFDILSNNVDCSVLLTNINLNVPARTTRQADFLRFPVHRTLFGQNNPFYVCCRRFNEVSDRFDFNMSKLTFKRSISS